MSNERGFTMISTMVAIILLSIGLIALSATGAGVVRAHTAAGGRSSALAIARAHLEALRTQPTQDLDSEDPLRVNGEGIADGTGAYVRSVEVIDVTHNLKQVAVRVAYPRSNLPVELVTLAFSGAY